MDKNSAGGMSVDEIRERGPQETEEERRQRLEQEEREAQEKQKKVRKLRRYFSGNGFQLD